MCSIHPIKMSLVEKIFIDHFQISLAILVILLGCAVILIKLIPCIPLLKKVTFVPFLFLVPMVLSSIGVIPVEYPLYKPLESITLYMAIFFMTVVIDIRKIFETVRPKVIILFLMACLGTVIGSVVAWIVFIPIIGHQNSSYVAAATTGVYSGGSMNWVAVCKSLDVPASLNAAAFPAAIMVYTLYLGLILMLEGAPIRKRLEQWLGGNMPSGTAVSSDIEQHQEAPHIFDFLLGFFAFCSVYLISLILEKACSGVIFIPQVIFLTTFAIVLGSCTQLKHLRGMAVFGESALYFLLCVIGAQGNIVETVKNAPILILFPMIVLVVHILFVCIFAKWLKIDLVTACITSVAGIGGAASAPVTAAVFKAEVLIPFGIILGSLGYVIGNYLGVYVGYFLLQL